jgi:two-component system, NtrC family, sensor kinase
MKCPRCQQDNPSHAKFCLGCGTPFGAISTSSSPAASYHEQQRALNEALTRESATSEILQVIRSSPTDAQPVFDAIARNAVALCGGIGVVLRFDGELLYLAGHHNASIEGVERLERVYPRRPAHDYPPGRALLDRSVVHVPDLQAATEFAASTARQRGAGSQLAVPLLLGQEAIGVITVVRNLVGPFSPQQIEMLKTFADQAVIAIENVRLFNETKEALERQTATAEILRVISSSQTDIQPVLDAVAENAARVCGASDAIIYRVDGDGMRRVAQFGALPMHMPEVVPLSRSFPAARSIIDRQTLHIDDLQTVLDTEYTGIKALRTAPGRIRTLLATPLMREGVPIGAILIRRLEVRPFTDKQIALLQTFADQAVIAIENVRLFTELQGRNRDLTDALARQTATSDVLRIISRSQTDLKPVFGAIVQSAVRLCDADLGGICKLEHAQLVPFAFSPDTADTWKVIDQAFPRPVDTTSLLGRAVVEARVVHVPDVEDPQAPHGVTTVSRGLSFRSQLSVPIIRDGQPIGVIGLSRREPGPFSDAAIDLVKTFADQAVIAIENARLLAELQARTQELTRSVDELTALSDVSRALSSTLDLDAILQTIVTRANQLAGTDACSVFEYDEGTEAFHLRTTNNLDEEVVAFARRTPVRKGVGVQGRMAITLQPVQIPNIAEEDAYHGPLRDILLRTGTRAVLAVPMLREGELIGGLTVNKKTPGEFPTEVIELLKTFATQSALAIQNARLFREIEQKSRELEAASRHKSEFLANMSHELRTPLNAIIGFSEVLGERMFGELNDKQDEYLKDINASGQHLLSLINDILDLSKIEAGRMELELTDFHLPAALDNALTLVRERAGRRGIALNMAVDERLEYVRADERKVRQVVLNLLSNAIKFTPEGGRIEVRTKQVDGSIEVSVSDTGVGIAPEDQEAIFEEFRQVGTADKKVEGTGLGLALSRKFVELHGGKIWVKSQVGEGSTFTFTVPGRR